ncbi:MAG TPA: TIM barrel protein [Candidatus Binatia bacterium]|jgi:sugar phosphate isomerase/epimerase|nr:TIM barrel protein [Candidatus Binatia bacterium]
MKNISRRDFLRTSVTAGAAALTSRTMAAPVEQPATPERSRIRLGLASYTFRNFGRTQLIGYMKQLNLADLNAKNVSDHLPADETGEAAALHSYSEAGIRLHAAGVISFAKDDDADIRAKFEYAKRARISAIVGGDPLPETLPRIERFVKEYDIRVAIHNHGPEDRIWRSPLDVLQAVKSLDPRIGCCIDVGHTVRTGTDVVQAIHEVGPRLYNIHMKDLTNFQDKESQVAVGDGKMPVRKIFEALLKEKYPGFVDLEYEVHPDDPMPGVARSYGFMRQVLADIARDPKLDR